MHQKKLINFLEGLRKSRLELSAQYVKIGENNIREFTGKIKRFDYPTIFLKGSNGSRVLSLSSPANAIYSLEFAGVEFFRNERVFREYSSQDSFSPEKYEEFISCGRFLL